MTVPCASCSRWPLYWSAPPPVSASNPSPIALVQLVIFALAVRSLMLSRSACSFAWPAVFRWAFRPMLIRFSWIRKDLASTLSIGTRLPAMPSKRDSSV